VTSNQQTAECWHWTRAKMWQQNCQESNSRRTVR